MFQPTTQLFMKNHNGNAPLLDILGMFTPGELFQSKRSPRTCAQRAFVHFIIRQVLQWIAPRVCRVPSSAGRTASERVAPLRRALGDIRFGLFPANILHICK